MSGGNSIVQNIFEFKFMVTQNIPSSINSINRISTEGKAREKTLNFDNFAVEIKILTIKLCCVHVSQ